VQSGDSLWSIARRHGVGVESLAGTNRLALAAILQPGQVLRIPAEGAAEAPAKATVVHVVQPGDTLWDIAGRYGTRVEDLMALNNLGHSEWIRPGQRLTISGGALPRHRQIAEQARRDGSASGQALAALAWPSRGTLTSRFGWRYRRHHDGIDLAAPRGTPFYAAADGVVEFAGWEGGYGRAIYINHGGGVVTLYGHASKILVRPGERVTKGQLIGRVGCTGSCTGPHLHFEVRVNGRATNPLKYLR
jgi:murein DD-endopeptidase MepM/ murein hydrolase activator NlpD